MADPRHIRWRQELRAVFTSEIDGPSLRSWGFFQFLQSDVERCKDRLEIAMRLYADLVDSDGAVDHLRGIYSCTLSFAGCTASNTPTHAAEVELANLSFNSINRDAIYDWFRKYVEPIATPKD